MLKRHLVSIKVDCKSMLYHSERGIKPIRSYLSLLIMKWINVLMIKCVRWWCLWWCCLIFSFTISIPVFLHINFSSPAFERAWFYACKLHVLRGIVIRQPCLSIENVHQANRLDRIFHIIRWNYNRTYIYIFRNSICNIFTDMNKIWHLIWLWNILK